MQEEASHKGGPCSIAVCISVSLIETCCFLYRGRYDFPVIRAHLMAFSFYAVPMLSLITRLRYFQYHRRRRRHHYKVM